VSASCTGTAPRTRRRARLAIIFAASGEPAEHARDLIERHREHVVQHEREALGRNAI